MMKKPLSKKEAYELQVQDLMDLIPASMVAKQVDVLYDDDEDGKILRRDIRWVVGDHVVYSGMRHVYSITPSDSEVFQFILKRPDYKLFVEACNARRKELFGKKQKTK